MLLVGSFLANYVGFRLGEPWLLLVGNFSANYVGFRLGLGSNELPQGSDVGPEVVCLVEMEELFDWCRGHREDLPPYVVVEFVLGGGGESFVCEA